MEKNVKVIFHIDLNQFFCSVAMIKNPRLVGKPFGIGRENTMKGVLSTASYEARKYGIGSGMSLVDAYRKLPSLIVVSYPYELYQQYSKKFFNLIREYQRNIEQMSIDEGFIDVTDITIKIGRHPLDLAKEIQKRALEELKLPCSIGIAPTLYLAKMASDMKKPLGITILRKRDVKKMLYPLPVKDIFGIGKKTYPHLMEKGINTIGDFVLKKDITISVIGENNYNSVCNCIAGNSTNVVDPYRYGDSESVSRSSTFDTPLETYEDVLHNILLLANEAYKDMINDKKKCKTIGIILRNKAFKTITRSHSLKEPTYDFEIIKEELTDLLDDNYTNEPMRLVGASLSHLVDINYYPPEEITLFNYEKYYGKEIKIDEIIHRFGNKVQIGIKEKEDKK